MASASLVGALRVTLGLDSAEFTKGLSDAQRQMMAHQKGFEKLGKKLTGIGEGMSKWLTVPILGAGAAVLKTAGDFEAGMGRVGISTQASAAQMEKLRDLALDIGQTTTKSASESAEAMDLLAKSGMSTADILQGGARAAVALAEAAGSGLEPAAAAVTDTMMQFGKTSKDLPNIINNITGAVNESKFSFEDFQYGMAQGGGVAASAGLKFEDFAAALAATASQFSSGQDAGTSMKTFLLSLTPSTKKARAAFDEFGFSAYDAQGNLKPLADIAQDLQVKFGALSDQDLNATFKEMFGTDAIRTAIGLMKQGSDGITEMQARIAATDASAQATQRMKGLNAEVEKLGGALETLAIKIADTGLLTAISGIVTSVAEWVDWMSKANPEILKWGVVIAGVVAVIGPLLIGIGSIVSAVGVMMPVIVAIGGALGTLAAVITGGAIPAIGALLVALAPILIPLGLIAAAVAGVYLAWKHWDKIEPMIRKIYTAAKTWLLDKLGVIFDWVGKKVEAVTGFFYGMWDKVVGHSYVPDMVDGIAQHFARLQGEMVDPAAKATQTTAEKFRAMAGEIHGLIAQLFPELAALDEYNKKLALIGKSNWSESDKAEARRRLFAQMADQFEPADDAPKIVMPDIDLNALADENVGKVLNKLQTELPKGGMIVKRTFEDIADNIGRTADTVANAIGSMEQAFGGFINSIKKGDIVGIIGGLADTIGSVLSAFGTGGSLSGLFKKGAAPKPRGYAGGTSFHPGGLAMVGERGRELVNLPRGSQVIPNHELRGMGGGKIQVEVVEGGMFRAIVRSESVQVAMAAAPAAAQLGSNIAQRSIAQRQSRRLA